MKQEVIDKQIQDYKTYQLQAGKTVKIVGLTFFCLYLLLAWVTPNRPNTDFFQSLNNFFDNYLFGYWLPPISDVFVFKAKTLWCSSLVLIPLQAVISFYWNYHKIGTKGVLAIHYGSAQFIAEGISTSEMPDNFFCIPLKKWKVASHKKNGLSVIIGELFFLVIFSIVSIWAYKDSPDETSLTITKKVSEVFYGNFYAFFPLFLFCQLCAIGALQKIFFRVFSSFKIN